MRKRRSAAAHRALNVYRQRCVRLSLTGFIIAARHAPAARESYSDEELLSSSSGVVEDVVPKKVQRSEPRGLVAPKRPGFLGPGRARAAPPTPPKVPGKVREDADAIVEALEGRYLELKARLEHEDGEEKQQTLDELGRLMNEIGSLASGLE
jgi:hypothetical protein